MLMNLSIGIVGLPNVGKSTLFKILTKNPVDIANYPFTTIEPNVGIVPVPDLRLSKIAEAASIPKKIPTTVKFVDIAGLVKGANKGEGLGNQFLSHIREVDAIVFVARCFKDENVAHTEGAIDPWRDIEILSMELILKDLETIERRLANLKSDLKINSKEAVKESELLNKIKPLISEGKFVSDYTASEDEQKILSSLQLLTSKPFIYLLNGDEKEIPFDFQKKMGEKNYTCVISDLKFLLEINELDENDRKLMESLGASDLSLEILIRQSYQILDLITFFTINDKEVRAWPVKKGTKAPEAAGKIHTDFEQKFIKAEVINWKKFTETGSWNNAREKGLLRLEGKDYIIQDGDIVLIKHG